MDLVDRSGSLGAIAPATGWVVRIPFHAPDRPVLLVHVSQKPASGLTVETGCGNYGEVFFHSLRPGLGIILHPIVPSLRRRRLFQWDHRHTLRQDRLMLIFEVVHGS